MANIAYVRVSTVEQNEGRQLESLKQHNIDKYFIEKKSGKNTDRPQLQAMLDYAREGDTVYIESFSRLARNTIDLLSLVNQMQDKGINIISLKEQLNSSTPTGKLMLTMIGAISTFEREIILERQREGIALAKKEGKYKGYKGKDKPSNWLELYSQYKLRQFTKAELARKLEISRPTLDRWIAELETENNTNDKG